jgi:tRNA (guanine-N7-)-methyltransferase
VGSKNKLKRFKENESFKNMIQPLREDVLKHFPFKGKWNTIFNNNRPIILELGCGKGEYTLALARKKPEFNFIGIDIKGARMWRGAKTALNEGLENVFFLRTQIELLDLCFDTGEVSEIWITFPDPQIKYKRTKHRLINEEFLKKYQSILSKDGIIHLKTDSEFLHGYLLGILHAGKHKILFAHHDIYNSTSPPDIVKSTQTFYEQQFLKKKKPITYIKFKTDYKE